MEIGTIVYLTEPCKWRKTPDSDWNEHEYPIGTPLRVIGDSGLRGPDLEFIENGVQMLECRFVKYSTKNPLESKKEFQPGEVFQFGLLKLRCEKIKSDKCEGCFFNDNNTYDCNNIYNILGGCCEFERSDNQDVIFVKVE